jgi:hypothetical protein
MPAHPERLAAGALLAALALSLVIGVALRDEIACGMVDASDLTRIGPGVYAQGGESASERAELLELVDKARAEGGQASAVKRESVVIFSDSGFWRGDADARTIATPFRSCIVIGSTVWNSDRGSLELSRASPPPPAGKTAITEAAKPDERGEPPMIAPAVPGPKPEEASAAPGGTPEPRAAPVESEPIAKPVAAAESKSPAEPRPAPGPAIVPTPEPAPMAVRDPAPAPPPLAAPAAPSRPPSLAPIPKPPAPPLLHPAPRVAYAPERAEPAEASAARGGTPEPSIGPVESEPIAKPVAAAESKLPAEPRPAPGPAIVPTPEPTPMAVRDPAPAPPPLAAPAAPSRPPSLARIPKPPAPPALQPAPPTASWVPARHVRPGWRPPELARSAPTPLAAPRGRPIAPRALAAAPPVRIRAPGASDRIEQPEDLTRTFAEPPLSEKWSRSESIYLPRDWQRIDTPQGLLYQARQREMKGSCSTSSTNGYFPCPKAVTRPTR